MKTTRFLLCSIIVLLANSQSQAQNDAWDYTVQLTATAQVSPPSIILQWKHDSLALSYTVFRRNLGDVGGWGNGQALPKTVSAYQDKTVVPNTTYEYRVLESAKAGATSWNANGFIASGINVMLPPQPGTVILLVDNSYSNALKTEIAQWTADLKAEGWGVIRHDVGRKDSVTAIKQIVYDDFNNDPAHVRSLFILGHVPVPYSGDIVPDGHVPGKGNHQGSWPADVYYGNFNTSWSDQSTTDTTAYDPRNKNIPGDGKFDQSSIEATMDLEVGRVDLYNMPNFVQSDTELLRQYLVRDHAFRTGALIVPKRALVNVNFGVFAYYDVPGEDAWRNFPPLVGKDNIVNFHSVSSAGDWFSYLDTAKYLWAYGCGGGSWASCSGVGTTAQFAKSGADAIFYMVFGSFFGDWDSQNNLTRAPLGTAFGLTSCWVSRPFWYYHPLAMGETFGYCAKITQNDGINGDYVVPTISASGIHVSLMGDPTLRMQYLSGPPSALSASIIGGSSVKLSWTAPTVAVPGYNIYRAKSSTDSMMKINPSPVTSISFTDNTPLNDTNVYVVRAVASTTTPSGSFWNESGGASVTVDVKLAGVLAQLNQNSGLRITSNEQSVEISFDGQREQPVQLSVIDITGREVLILSNGTLPPGVYNYHLNKSEFATGAYFIRMLSSDGVRDAKFLVTR